MVVRIAQASIASTVDTLFGAIALGRSKRSRQNSRAESLSHAERMAALDRICERYSDPRYVAPPDVFFGGAGRAGAWESTRVRRMKDGEVVDVRWTSDYEPLAHEAEVRDRYLARTENAHGHARLWLHERPRPAVILIHGYLGGSYAVEERAWPMRWLFDRLGLDVALPVLPFHGVRNKRGRRPLFPSSDPRINVEGFRHAVFDLVSLRRSLSARGAPAVGVMGMSLGGYTSALMLTADAELAFGVPMIPLASVADFARDAGRLVGTKEEQDAQHAAIEAAHAPVSPLARPSLVAPERVRVVAGEADRITPSSHALRLSKHLGARLFAFPGGHLLQFGRGEGFREVARMLAELKLLPPR